MSLEQFFQQNYAHVQFNERLDSLNKGISIQDLLNFLSKKLSSERKKEVKECLRYSELTMMTLVGLNLLRKSGHSDKEIIEMTNEPNVSEALETILKMAEKDEGKH